MLIIMAFSGIVLFFCVLYLVVYFAVHSGVHDAITATEEREAEAAKKSADAQIAQQASAARKPSPASENSP